MARLVKTTVSHPLSDPTAIGIRCAQSETSDIVDADLAIWAEVSNDLVVTTDPTDMARLGVRHASL